MPLHNEEYFILNSKKGKGRKIYQKVSLLIRVEKKFKTKKREKTLKGKEEKKVHQNC